MGAVVPTDNGDFTNRLPDFLEESPLYGDAAAAASELSEASGMVRALLIILYY